MGAEQMPLKLLVLDTAYTFEMVTQRGLQESIICRDLSGFFLRVWSVHPFATLLTTDAWTPRYGSANFHKLCDIHTIIEGKVGRFRWLRSFPSLNFLASQIDLFILLARLIKRERISVIRVGSPLYLGLFGWALSQLCRIPLVVRVGGNHDKIFQATGRPLEPRLMRSRKIEKAVERFVFERADLVAGANRDNLNFALANGARSERAVIFRYGNLIDRKHFATPSIRGGNRDYLKSIGVDPKGFLLYIGRLEAVKLPDDVIRVLAEVRRRGFDVKAVLVGDGRLHAMLMELAVNLGVEKHVVFAGNRDQEWLSEIIPSASVIISPHTGRALSEAALGAAPIVAYDIDWQGEIIETGQTGILVRYRLWRELADGVERFLIDKDYARAMGDAARKRALEMMNPETLDEYERQQYLKLLQQRGG